MSLRIFWICKLLLPLALIVETTSGAIPVIAQTAGHEDAVMRPPVRPVSRRDKVRQAIARARHAISILGDPADLLIGLLAVTNHFEDGKESRELLSEILRAIDASNPIDIRFITIEGMSHAYATRRFKPILVDALDAKLNRLNAPLEPRAVRPLVYQLSILAHAFIEMGEPAQALRAIHGLGILAPVPTTGVAFGQPRLSNEQLLAADWRRYCLEDLARKEAQSGHYAAAEQAIKIMHPVKLTFVDLRVEIARAQWPRGDRRGALLSLREIAREIPSWINQLSTVAELQNRMGDHIGAVTTLRAAVAALNPSSERSDPPGYMRMALAQMQGQIGDRDGLRDTLKVLIKSALEQPDALRRAETQPSATEKVNVLVGIAESLLDQIPPTTKGGAR